MPFGLGWLELSIILVIVIVIFGAGKLPEIGSSLGKSIRGFKSEISEGNKEIEEKKGADKAATTVTPMPTASSNAPTETRAAAAPSAPKDDAVR